MSKSICCSHSDVDSLELTFQRKLITEAIAARTIHNGQSFCIASNVSSPPAMELPGPGLFASDASAALRQEEPANDASQLLSLPNRNCWLGTVSQTARSP